jgi:hypothetical protein
MEQYIRLLSDQVKQVRWLLKAVSKVEERVAMQHVLIEGDTAATTDGYRLHTLSYKHEREDEFSFYKFDDGQYRMELHQDILVYERCDDPPNYPNYASIQDNGLSFDNPNNLSGKVLFSISPHFLRDALSLPIHTVTMTFGQYFVAVFDDDYLHAEAMIMPMHADGFQYAHRDDVDQVSSHVYIEWLK